MATALPVELVELIFSFIDEHDKQMLASLCSVNKLFNDIATPTLYKTIGISKLDLGMVERSRILQSLCRTLTHNLPLTQHVKEISYDGQHNFPVSQPLIEGLELQGLADVLSRDLDVAEYVQDALAEEEWDDMILDDTCLLALIAICPKAESLRIVKCGQYLTAFLALHELLDERKEEERLYRQANFHGIRNLHVLHAGHEPDPIVQDIAPWLCLPSLESLYIQSLDRWNNEYIRAPVPQGCGTMLTKLKVESCSAKATDLEWLLGMCSSLETLEIKWLTCADNYRRFDWAILGTAIRQSCPELRSLLLDHPRDFMLDDEEFQNIIGDMNDEYVQDAHLPGLGSLKQLSKLETLTLSNIALFGTHRDDEFEPLESSDEEDNSAPKHSLESLLPASLKELIILCEHQSLSRKDKELLGEAGSERLDSITIMNCQKDHGLTKTGDRTSEIKPVA